MKTIETFQRIMEHEKSKQMNEAAENSIFVFYELIFSSQSDITTKQKIKCKTTDIPNIFENQKWFLKWTSMQTYHNCC